MDPAREQGQKLDAVSALAEFAALSVGRGELLADVLERFTTIAHIIGHDFAMKVSYGRPFGGNYFTYPPPSVVLDPVHVLRNVDEAEFIVEHEGAHRYNTYSPLHPDLEPILKQMFPIEALVKAIGFNGVFNGIEDPTINRWLTDVYTGTKEKMTATYDRMFLNEDAKLYTPDVALAEMVLGFYPKFGVYSSAIIRKWHSGSWGENIEADVLRALKTTSDTVDRMFQMTVNKTGAPEAERQILCLKRYINYISNVWPIVKTLIADDVEEAGFQAFRRAVQKNPDIGNPPSPEQGGQGQEGQGESQPQQGQPGEGQGEGKSQKHPNKASGESPGQSPQSGDSQAEGAPSEGSGGGSHLLTQNPLKVESLVLGFLSKK